jgi:glycosyltransferase involved in cell wall biosynthesis
MQPLSSVIIPAYNQGQYLGEAIESVLRQTRQDFEIIVVDDGSTDDTRAVVAGYRDPRIRYLYQQNQGLPAARNTGIRAAEGEYLSFLDSDDLFLPHKLELLTGQLEQHPEAGLAAGQAIPFDEWGQHPDQLFDAPLPSDGARLLLHNPLHVGSVVLRRSWQQRVGLFDATLRSYEDWDLWLRLLRAGCPTHWVAEPVSLYRFHTAQMVRTGDTMTRASFAVLDKTFAAPDLPESWLALRDQAYAAAYLRSAANHYRSQAFDAAAQQLARALELNPDLRRGDTLHRHFAAWAVSPKIADPVRFLQGIYDHLPLPVHALQRNKGPYLAQTAWQTASSAYARHDYAGTRKAVLHAVQHQPALLRNRGLWSMFVRSCLAVSQRRRA